MVQFNNAGVQCQLFLYLQISRPPCTEQSWLLRLPCSSQVCNLNPKVPVALLLIAVWACEQEETILPRVPLSACLERWRADEEVADYYSAAVGGKTTAIKHNRLANFPEYLMIQLNRCAPPDYAFSEVHIAGKAQRST